MSAAPTLLEYLRPVQNGSRREICLAAMAYLAAHGREGISASDLKAELISARVPKAKQFNVADVLGRAGALVSAAHGGRAIIWTLTGSGRSFVAECIPTTDDTPEIRNTITGLSTVLSSVTDPVIKGYVEEALVCYQADARRAAVVFLWTGVIRHLQDQAWTHGAAAVTAAVQKHDQKAKAMTKFEDFSSVKDVTQLLAFRDLSMIDKGQWATLQEGLDLRNRCGHPTKYRPGAAKVASFVEDVVGIAFV